MPTIEKQMGYSYKNNRKFFKKKMYQIFLDSIPKRVVIELQKIKYKKPYYGGFVNKTNGTYYYHAYAQTDQYKNPHLKCQKKKKMKMKK